MKAKGEYHDVCNNTDYDLTPDILIRKHHTHTHIISKDSLVIHQLKEDIESK